MRRYLNWIFLTMFVTILFASGASAYNLGVLLNCNVFNAVCVDTDEDGWYLTLGDDHTATSAAACFTPGCGAGDDCNAHARQLGGANAVWAGTILPGLTGDCNDGNASVHPGALDVCGNGIDEDCFGGDAACPTVTSVSSPVANGTYGVGAVVPVTVTFSEAVSVAGAPRLSLETGATDSQAHYSTGSGGTVLTFNYTVSAGDTSSDLDYVSNAALTLNGGTIKKNPDGTGNAVLALPSPGSANSLGSNKAIVIDTSEPPSTEPPSTEPELASIMYVTSTTATGTYAAGSVIGITVRFSQTVWVSGTPQLILRTGDNPELAYYSIGSGTDTLTFLYTVVAGDMVSKLAYWSQWALELNGGRIWDRKLNDAILILPAPGTPGSLSGNMDLSLDTDSPVYRFYSPGLAKHFYTIDENEKNHLINNAADVWQFEYIAYYAFNPLQYKAASRQQRNTIQAVYRFYSENLYVHLFTIDETEKDYLIANAAEVWRFEGPAFYVPVENEEGVVPVYRFYSEALMVHLFTVDENEKNHLIHTAGDVWRFEGIAYYAYP